MFSFATPWVALLVFLPFIVYKTLRTQKRQQQAALIFPAWIQKTHPEILQQNGNSRLARWLLALAWLSLVLALMQPMWTGDPIRIKDNGRDLMLAIDLSGSMSTEDFVVNGQASSRFAATRKIVGEFIEKRKGDRIGIIFFGDHAYLQSPLTFDLKTDKRFLNEAFIGMAGEKTAIGEAIGLAIKKLKNLDNPEKVLILITDGANTSGIDPIEASKIAQKEHIVIHTIGVGADELIVQGFFGRQKVNPSRDLDEYTLRMIAQNTGGYYFRARDTEELQRIYQKLDALNPVKRENLTFRPQKALYFWPLLFSVIFLMLAAGVKR